MELKKYENTGNIPEKFLESLVDAQIECWGSNPFDEYKICNRNGCRALYSIQDIYGNLVKYKEKKSDYLDYKCSECGGNTEFVYEKEKFLEQIKDYIKTDVSTILLINKTENVEGFGIVKKAAINDIINLELSTRPNSYDLDLIGKKLSNNIFGSNDLISNKILCLHHIYTSFEIRGLGFGILILKEMLDIIISEGLAGVLETRYDSNGYLIARGIGFEKIAIDKYGYVLMYIKKIETDIEKILINVLSNLKTNSFENNRNNIVSGRKFYS